MTNSLSPHDDIKFRRLPNWGFWGRHDTCKPDPERGTSSVYSLGKRDLRDLDEDAPQKHDVIHRVDYVDAEIIDAWMRKLMSYSPHAFTIIRRRYYHRPEVRTSNLSVDRAIRTLIDLMESHCAS